MKGFREEFSKIVRRSYYLKKARVYPQVKMSFMYTKRFQASSIFLADGEENVQVVNSDFGADIKGTQVTLV